jgi:hypothetical protein
MRAEGSVTIMVIANCLQSLFCVLYSLLFPVLCHIEKTGAEIF